MTVQVVLNFLFVIHSCNRQPQGDISAIVSNRQPPCTTYSESHIMFPSTGMWSLNSSTAPWGVHNICNHVQHGRSQPLASTPTNHQCPLTYINISEDSQTQVCLPYSYLCVDGQSKPTTIGEVPRYMPVTWGNRSNYVCKGYMKEKQVINKFIVKTMKPVQTRRHTESANLCQALFCNYNESFKKISGSGSRSRLLPKFNQMFPEVNPSKKLHENLSNFLSYPANKQTNRQTEAKT